MTTDDIKQLRDYIFEVMKTNEEISSYIKLNDFIEKLYHKYDITTTLPIDVYKLLYLFGLSNYKEEEMDSTIRGYFSNILNQSKIVINEKMNGLIKRSTIAYCLIEYILKEEMHATVSSSQFVPSDPLFYTKMNIANLMLLPLRVFEDEFLSYLDESERCGNINDKALNEWPDILANRSQIDKFHLVCLYPILCKMITHVENIELKNNHYDINKLSEKSKKYRKLFGNF